MFGRKVDWSVCVVGLSNESSPLFFIALQNIKGNSRGRQNTSAYKHGNLPLQSDILYRRIATRLDYYISRSRNMYNSQRDIGQEIKEEFLPRSDKYKDLINSQAIPITNESVVVIPCLTKTYGFKTNQYKAQEKFLKGVITEEYFNSFVRKANRIIENELIKKSEGENEPFFKLISLLIKVSIVLSVLALLLMVIITYFDMEDTISKKILYVSVALLGSSSLVAALCPIFLYNSKYSSMNYELIIGQKLKTLEGEQNMANQANGRKHLKWHVQNKFYWIQLHIARYMINKPKETGQSSD